MQRSLYSDKVFVFAFSNDINVHMDNKLQNWLNLDSSQKE